MNESEPLSPETRDPFHVPDRTLEVGSFFCAVGMTLALPFAFSLPPSTLNMAVVLSGALIALLALLRGLEERRHRLNRIQAVNELRDAIRRASEEEVSP
jgi:TRAP-type C4-dicarboxylate transport system permease small subunit